VKRRPRAAVENSQAAVFHLSKLAICPTNGASSKGIFLRCYNAQAKRLTVALESVLLEPFFLSAPPGQGFCLYSSPAGMPCRGAGETPSSPVQWLKLAPKRGNSFRPPSERGRERVDTPRGQRGAHRVVAEPFWSTSKITECRPLLAATTQNWAGS
jgi:hypothetical protein